MIKLIWFIPKPARDIDEFERWYQTEHIPIGMRQEGLKRFRVSRSFYPQPEFVTRITGMREPSAYRFSEGYWNGIEDIRHCYASVNGRAAIADGMLNAQFFDGTRPTSPVVIAEEEHFPVIRELSFNLRMGRYEAPLACKLFGFVRLRNTDRAAFDRSYRTLACEASSSGELRGHVLSSAKDEVIKLGGSVQWPPATSERYDRALEYYFDSVETMDRFCDSHWMRSVLDHTSKYSASQTWDAVTIQEVFYTSPGDQPLEASWRALYAGSSSNAGKTMRNWENGRDE